MLLSRRRSLNTVTYDTTSVHNYYERLVNDAIMELEPRARSDYDFFADVSCVALNHLPPRYIRHDVDMSFYLSPIELDEIQKKVAKAVRHAVKFVNSREQENKVDEEDKEH